MVNYDILIPKIVIIISVIGPVVISYFKDGKPRFFDIYDVGDYIVTMIVYAMVMWLGFFLLGCVMMALWYLFFYWG